MKHKLGWIFGLFFLFVYIPNFIYTFDCYYCENCLNNQRGVRIVARPEDWCYKIVWPSGRGNQQIVSRGASSDCRQDSYNDQDMAIPGVFSGVGRYCCRKHLYIFPVELIHELLSYFSAGEIFYTFTNISSYIDNVLFTYSKYRVDFKSITKREFDIVCQQIIPNQVISLILCDNENTPGQMELFLSRFQIDQFTCLRSLTLIDIGPEFWEPIVTKLNSLKNLRSFLYISSTKIDSWITNISDDEVTELDKRLSDIYGPILPQLNRLTLSHGDFLESIQFPYLHHLTIERCKVDIIKYICFAAPQLKSLSTGFRYNKSNTEFIFPFGQLNRLTLRIGGSSVSMKNMEQLLGNFPSLKYLELHANGHADLVDGKQWQKLTNRLITFNFNFYIPNDLESQDLDSFRSPYWLDEKHWFVACINRSLLSVPYFAETCTNDEFQPITVSTLPDNTIFYNYITQLTLSEPVVDINQRFPRVHTLAMVHSIPLSSIERIVDLNRVQQLDLYSKTDYSGIRFIINEMSNLCRISIKSRIKCFLEEVQYKSYDKIRKLEIGNRYSTDDDYEDDYSIEQLCIVFPKIEHLNIGHWDSRISIFHFINRFPQLSTVSFRFSNWIISEEQRDKNIIEVKSILEQNRLFHKFDYTYRFDRSSVYIWL
ncbi:unnamed protein product [Rotaria sordida]|uniref:F-box domain-containing protein n=1 Tax=Rotaria sordida TaxID=392033 RepID=A0A815EHY9_9BILA|nr:unnamed protein product [Rotaria sordida]